MRVERVVLDTNVLNSAALSPLGKSFACLGWTLDHATLIVSRELLDELETRLARPKFAKYLDERRRRVFVAELAVVAVQVELSGVVSVCRDPDDDKLLENRYRRTRGLSCDRRPGFAGSPPLSGCSDPDAGRIFDSCGSAKVRASCAFHPTLRKRVLSRRKETL